MNYLARLRPGQLLMLVPLIWGGVILWALCYRVHPDIVSYADISEKLVRGDFEALLNSYWSPGLAVMTALFQWILQTFSLSEYPSVVGLKIACFIGFAAFIGAYLWLITELKRCFHFSDAGLPMWFIDISAMIGLTLLIFRFNTFILIDGVPDAYLGAALFASTALWLRTFFGKTSNWEWIGLGVIMGLGYLFKTIMLPYSVVLIAVGILSKLFFFRASDLQYSKIFLLMIVPWVVICSLWVFGLSLKYDRVTIGDSGFLNYLWYVNRFPVRAQAADTAPVRQLKNPPQIISMNPKIISHQNIDHVTWPFWYDPGLHLSGINSKFNWAQQSERIKSSLNELVYSLLKYQAPLLGLIISLVIMIFLQRYWTREIHLKAFFICLPPLAGLFSYLLSVPIETRYIAPFILILLGVLLFLVRIPKFTLSRGALVIFLLVILAWSAGPVFLALKTTRQMINTRENPIKIVQALKEFGIQPGAKVAVLFWGYNRHDLHAHWKWAKLAQVNIVAEILAERDMLSKYKSSAAKDFVLLPRSSHVLTLNALRSTGAQWVAGWIPDRLHHQSTLPWQNVKDVTGFFLLSLE